MLQMGEYNEYINSLPSRKQVAVCEDSLSDTEEIIPDFFLLLRHLSPSASLSELYIAYHHLVDCIVNTTPTLLYVYDLVARQNIWSNAAHRRFFGGQLAAEPALANHTEIVSYVHPKDQSKLESVLHSLQNTINGESIELEYRVCAPEGGYRWFCDRVAVLQRDREGKVVQIIGSMLEITERVKAVQALHASEDKYRLVVTSMTEGIVLQHRDGRITACNPAAERILGLTADQMMGRTSLDPRWRSIHEDGSPFPGETHPAMTTLRTGQPQHNIVMGVHKPDGTLTWILINSEPLFHPDIVESYAVVATFQDITERKQLESRYHQAQKMEAIGTLAGGIAHDFNNILTPILGYAELAMRYAPADAKLQRNLARIIEGSQRAKELVRQILAFSRHVESEQKPVSLAALITEVLKLLRHMIPATIEIQTDLQENGAWVFADPSQLHQIIMNLCTNAYHAIGETHGQIVISLARVQMHTEPDCISYEAMSGDYIKLTVQDTGCGMDQVTMSRIFDPFFTTKGVGKGTGLGLSVVHGIVQSLHGVVDVQSEVGKGSTFTLYLPCYEQPEPKENAAVQVEQIISGSERIFLVDDEQVVAEVLQKLLESYGYHVTTSNIGAVALELFHQAPHAFDLIIVDQVMPGLTGDQFIDAALKIRPTIPILMLSGYSERISPQQVDAIGIQGFLYKPVDAVTLCKSVRQALATEAETPTLSLF